MSALHDLSATEISQRLERKELSAVALMEATLARIDAVNPTINAIVDLRPKEALMREAAEADAAPRRGWLHGIPMAVKDLIAVRGIRKSSGSPIFADRIPDADEMVAARLRAAGAILIGKTNTPEFGLGSHSYNPVHGVTRNPYDPGRSAGGSSGGAAAALAARMVSVADGSDMMGSLRNPAAFCNVYGFRPSYGLVPFDPVGETFLHQLATEGPMARTIEDLARLLTTLSGHDPRLPHSLHREAYAEDLDIDIRGKRIGWLGDWGGAYPTEPGILPLCEAALTVFADQGATVTPLAPPFPPEELWQSWVALRSWDIAMERKPLYDDPATRALLKPEAIWEIEHGLSLDPITIHQASVIRSAWFARLAELFETYDALALPSAQVWPFPAGWDWPKTINGRQMDSYHRWMEVVIPVSLVGLPALALPAGFGPQGLPMGLQIFGPRAADRAILRLGQAYHRATDWPGRNPPALDLAP